MVRLVDRVDVNGFATGTLQVFCEGAWGAVCSSNFDDRDAQVACRQLGFTAGSSTPREPGFRQSIPDSVWNFDYDLCALAVCPCLQVALWKR